MLTKCVVDRGRRVVAARRSAAANGFTLLSLSLPRTDGRSRNRLGYDSTGSLSDALGRNGQTVGYRRDGTGAVGRCVVRCTKI